MNNSITIERIKEVLKTQYSDKEDLSLIDLAYEYAEEAHRGQKRLSGEDYIQHSLETAYRLTLMKLDLETVAAGLLHDVPEDTPRTTEEVKKEFGEGIGKLVEGITKLGKIKYRGLDRYAENLRKMFMAMAEDIRVVFIKFADRIHNLKTLYALPPVKQQRIARETLEIYAPIAHRLGMGELRGELEDLAFPYVYPEEYQWVKKITQAPLEERKKVAEKAIKSAKKILHDNKIDFLSVHGRVKHYFSLYKKLLRKNKDISKVYDLVALRIIVKEVKDCYHVLGLLHAHWRPLPGRIKDYIAQPKPNGYQSLHTTVFYNNGHIVEFQIRTQKMHEYAEYGIASHWHYKEHGSLPKLDKEKMRWLEQLIKLQKEFKDSGQFLSEIKIDIFQDRIFVFTPKGDVIDLPEGATPVDFAYHIHTELGDHCGGARVNEKIAPLNTKLKSGDMVEIIKDPNRQGPSEDWLEFVKTHMARTKIRSYLRKERRSKLIQFFYRD